MAFEKRAALEVNGVHTDVLVLPYADRTFVVVTQLKKLGTLVLVTRDDTGHMGAPKSQSFQVRTLLGRRDDPLTTLYGRQLLEQMRSEKPLLLAVCLKDNGRDSGTFQAVIDKVLEMGGW